MATEKGVPSMRVIGSGARIGAKSDVKVAVPLLENGEFPEADEASCLLRAECKNRATNPELPYELMKLKAFAVVQAPDLCPELPFVDLSQDAASKVVVWRRAKVPNGALSEKKLNEVFVAVMGGGDWLDMVAELMRLRQENVELKAKQGV